MAALANSQSPFGGASASIERLPMFRTIFERAAAACTQEFRAAPVSQPQLTIAGLETGAAGDVFAEHDGPIVAVPLQAQGWNTRLLASARRNTVFAIVEMMLGGDGSQAPYAGKKPFSKIETRIFAAFLERFAKALSAAAAAVAPTPVTLEAPAAAIDFEVFGGRTTAVFAVRLNLEVMGRGGEIVVAVPQTAIAALRQAFSRTSLKQDPEPDPHWSRQIEREITRASVALSAVLDERTMTLGDVSELRVGQVIHLTATPRSRVHLECDGERMVLCEFGKSNGVYTLRVDEFIDREQEFMNDLLAG
ncbi:MAG TPA: FliM/FliN family flagellar motor switch protein [Hyphomicrobiaceae bacterium]|nr:FliM/FliN family flagellar motor switch protein [Hyphomicrobiaceae bacterium]